jgi:hypothetical protein
MNKNNIARIIYDAYPHADLLPIDPEQDCRDLKTLFAKVTTETIGDGLFTFLVVETVEGGENTLDGVIRVIERAREDVEAVLHVLEAKQTCECNSADYCEAAEYIAEQGRKIFTGPMNGGLWNARCMDASILSRKEDDKAAYEFLLDFGDKYAQQLSDNQKVLWHQIKENALLRISKSSEEMMTTPIVHPAEELLEACKVLTSYTMDLLYRLDNQVNLEDVEEIQQAKEAISKYSRITSNQS